MPKVVLQFAPVDFQSRSEGAEDAVHNGEVGVAPHKSNAPHLACSGAEPAWNFHKVPAEEGAM